MSWVIPALIVLIFSGVFIMFGIGGAAVFIPVFYQLGIEVNQARLAGLVIVVVSTGVASSVYMKRNLLSIADLREALFILLGMLIAVPIGAFVASMLSDKFLIGLFSLALFASAGMLILGKNIKAYKKDSIVRDETIGFLDGLGAGIFRATMIRSVVGSSAGFVNGALGIGGGVFIVPVLILTGTKPKKAVMLSVLCVFLASLFSVANNLAYVNADVPLLVAVGVAALIGSFAGSNILASGRIEGRTIRDIFPIILGAFAIKLAIDFFML